MRQRSWMLLLVLSAAAGACSESAGKGGTASEGCVTGTLAAGDATVTLQHDGVAREYIVHVPPNLDSRVPVPLVLDIHGLTSNDAQQESLSGWREKSDAAGFVAAWPNGLDASWNGGSLCCGTSQASDV